MIRGHHKRTEYENYILVSEHSKWVLGTYPNFLKLKEVMSTLNQMVSKNNNTYTYYGEVYVSHLTAPEINKIQDCLDTGKWTSSFEKIKHICVDLGIVRF